MNTPFERRIVETADGSYTFELIGKKEHYHSTFGAVQESFHIYIRNGLLSLSGKSNTISILEVGFGTGLNALLTIIEAMRLNMRVTYLALEPFALEPNEYELLNYTSVLNRSELAQVYFKLHESEWNHDIEIMPGFVFRKEKTGLQTVMLPENFFDLVYFDAFGPDTQPELWTQVIFEKVGKAMLPGAILATFCVRGSVRRAMQASGFEVLKLPGPLGKREMTRALKL